MLLLLLITLVGGYLLLFWHKDDLNEHFLRLEENQYQAYKTAEYKVTWTAARWAVEKITASQMPIDRKASKRLNREVRKSHTPVAGKVVVSDRGLYLALSKDAEQVWKVNHSPSELENYLNSHHQKS